MTDENQQSSGIKSSNSGITNEQLAADLKKLSEELKEQKTAIDKDKVNIITLVGIFVSIFTFISIDVQIFNKACDFSKIVGTISFSAGVLILFVMAIYKIASNWIPPKDSGDAVRKDNLTYATIAILCIILISIGSYFVSHPSSIECSTSTSSINNSQST